MARSWSWAACLVLFAGFVAAGCRTLTPGGAKRDYYRVYLSEGDSLADIAARYHSTAEALITLNHISDVSQLRIGQMINVPRVGKEAAKPPEAAPPSLFFKPATQSLKTDGGPQPFEAKEERRKLRHDPRGSKKPQGLLFAEGSRPLNWPIQGRLTSLFGIRRGRLHAGIDLTARPGTPVVAAAAGKVVTVDWERGYGHYVILAHGTHTTLYAHLAKTLKTKGALVAQGERIGIVGQSGNAHGYHLHFEFRDASGKSEDPLPHLPENRLVASVTQR